MANIDDIVAKLEVQTTEIGNLEVFVQELKDALANAGVPQEKLDEVFGKVEANTARIVAAMAANLPPV